MKSRDKYIITGVVMTVLLIIFLHFMPLLDLKVTSSFKKSFNWLCERRLYNNNCFCTFHRTYCLWTNKERLI